MEGWVFRRDLVPPRRLKEFSRRSDGWGALQSLSQIAAMLALGWAIAALWGTWWAVPVFIAQGCVLWGFGYAGQHELLHRTVFATRQLNDWVGYLSGFLRFFQTDYSRAWHFIHHRHTKDPEKDSELAGTTNLTLRGYLWHLLGIDYFIYRWKVLFRVAAGRRTEPYFTDEDFRPLVTEARVHLVLYALIAAASVAFESWAALKYWVGPLLVTAPFYRFYITAEHFGRPQVSNIVENTRTTDAGWLLRWLMWNMPYHTEHHLFPGVPFHRLGTLSRELRANPNGAMAANEIAPGHIAVCWRIFKGLRSGDAASALR
jgi:fatty acid desaturase